MFPDGGVCTCELLSRRLVFAAPSSDSRLSCASPAWQEERANTWLRGAWEYLPLQTFAPQPVTGASEDSVSRHSAGGKTTVATSAARFSPSHPSDLSDTLTPPPPNLPVIW